MAIKIETEGLPPSELQKLKGFDTKQRRRFNKLLRETFGESVKFIGAGNLARFKTSFRTFETRFVDGNSQLQKEVLDLYVRAWHNRYATVAAELKARSRTKRLPAGRAGIPSGLTAWQRFKFRNIGKAYPPTNLPINSVAWGYTTSFLFTSVEEGLRSGGNSFVSLPNVLLQGAIRFRAGLYPRRKSRSYVVWFVNMLTKMGILSDEESLVDFSPNDWAAIRVAAEQQVRRTFYNKLVQLIRNFE